MRTQELFNQFVNNTTKKKKCNSCFIEDNAVYSYGYHFPLCVKLIKTNGEFIFLVNKDKYSVSTSKHQSWLNSELKNKEIMESNTKKLKYILLGRIKEFNELILGELN